MCENASFREGTVTGCYWYFLKLITVDSLFGGVEKIPLTSTHSLSHQGWDIQWCKEARDAAHRIAAMEEPHFDHATWIQLGQKRLVYCNFRKGTNNPRLKIHMSTDP